MKIYLIGSIVSDIILPVESLCLNSISWQLAKDCSVQPGGISTSAIALSELGLPSTILGWTGNDIIGDKFLLQLASKAIDISRIHRYTFPTIKVYCIIDNEGNHARIVHKDENIDKLVADWDWNQVNFTNEDIVFINGFACLELPTTSLISLVQVLSKKKVHIVFDPQTALGIIDSNIVKLIVRNAKTLTINEEEASKLFLLFDINLNNWRHPVLSGKSIFLRRGAEGVDVIESAKQIHIPALKCIPKNTLGAGDTFNSAILYGLNKELTSVETAILGNVMASLQVRSLDISNGVPSLKEIESTLFEAKKTVYNAYL